MYDKVLVSVVHPKISEAVSEIAACIVDLNGKITVLNVIEVPYHLPYMYADEKMDFANKLVEQVRKEVDMGTAPTVKVDSMIIVARSSAEVIIEEAKKGRYDLILMGASARTKTQKMLFGDVVDYVLKNTPCDVIVMSYLEKVERRYDRILLTTTGYKHSRKAIQVAEALAKWHENVVIETLCIAERPTEKKIDESIVNGIKRIFSRDGIRSLSKVLVSMHVAKTILEEAKKGNYNLILMGATEKPKGYRFVLGSVVDEVVRNAPCEVMVIKTVGES